MPTFTLTPSDSDVSNNAVTAVNAATVWEAVGDNPGVGQPDTDYAWASTGDASVNLGDAPAGVSFVTKAQIRAYTSKLNFTDDTCYLFGQVFASDGTTSYTDEKEFQTVGVLSANAFGYAQNSLVTMTLTAAGQAAVEADWDTARLRLRWAYTANMGADGGELRLHAVEVVMTYGVSWAEADLGKHSTGLPVVI